MPFNQKPQKFNAKINAVTIGSGDKTVTIGGDCTFPFYSFDAESENCPQDPYQRHWLHSLQKKDIRLSDLIR